ncbi:LacI family DNA-binding transcriptional regulator [Schaalia odontolytica]|jgi:HTH-type transcriptional regulator reg1|uniref:LacI family DNA-binding transcriptional regulator n=1 Tax=Schaalia odontolytica TaxID=1660 RepID=UPI001D07BDD5|nr:LacI family DNA-binding transcriptional regulator [Schaalia odontolytica]MCB6401937.1 LacI family transcriptional regulator [Schaalia odontolytica]
MTKNRTSMADIAVHAGVSTATVSRVFNGVGQVSDETRRKVLTAIDELGYDRPTPERTPDTPTIGVIVPELTNPIFAAFAHHLQEEVARAGGIAMIRSQTPGATSEFDHLSSLLEHRASGLIFVSGRHADLLADLGPYHEVVARSIPLVTINGTRAEIPAPDFSTDDTLGIRAAVTHLHELGHSRIALLTGRTHIVPALRKAEAFTQVMEELVGDHSPIIEETFYTYEAAAAHTNGLIERGVTAIVTGSDLQALGAIRTITSLGLSVPEDISVIGFDDSFLMSHLSPGLTTVHQPVPAIVAAAVRNLFEALATPDYTPEHADYVFSPDLVVRATTARAK